jgi:hypothetical protein
MITALWTIALLTACRPDPGSPTYPTPDPVDLGGDGSDLLEGPDPYVEGEARLSLGVHYESGYSEVVAIDDVTTHYYVYSSTYTEDTDSQDRVEGRVSTVLTIGNAGWFGGGIHWDGGRDLSDWTTMVLSLRSSDTALEGTELRMVGGVEAGVPLSDYGFAADGTWHQVVIPLADLDDEGVDLTAITVAFMLIGEGVGDGDELKVDDLYLTQD